MDTKEMDTESRFSSNKKCFHDAQEAEINLLDILKVLSRQRKWIVLIGVAVTILSVVYALSLPSIYRSETTLILPDAGDIIRLSLLDDQLAMNAKELDGYRHKNIIDQSSIFGEMVTNLNSNDVKSHFLKAHAEFKGSLSITPPNRSSSKAVVYAEGENPEMLAPLVNEYVSYCNNITIRKFVEAEMTDLQDKKTAVLKQIEILRNSAQRNRQDRIAKLQEAFDIAQKLGVNEMKTGWPGSPLYLHGTKALSAEIETLQHRKSDDPFIEGLRKLQIILKELNQQDLDAIDMSDIHAARIISLAETPKQPVRPKRTRLIILGSIFGFLGGVFSAFLIDFLHLYKKGGGKSEGHN